VNTRAEAEAAVRATRYPPQGERGIGGSRTRLYGGGDYVQHANEEILLIAEIEHRDGVANAEAILSTPGIDAYFIGPGDLCASLGLPHTLGPGLPRVLERARTRAQRGGKRRGCRVASTPPPPVCRRCSALGTSSSRSGSTSPSWRRDAAGVLDAARAKR
jgi:2-keto-3-deoxy-L-rhamnonate aldolase RhmA